MPGLAQHKCTALAKGHEDPRSRTASCQMVSCGGTGPGHLKELYLSLVCMSDHLSSSA